MLLDNSPVPLKKKKIVELYNLDLNEVYMPLGRIFYFLGKDDPSLYCALLCR